MRVSLSSLAWAPQDDAAVADLLLAHRVDAIDLTPAHCFANPAEATEAEIHAIRQRWEDRGIAIIGMQALLSGTRGLALFGSVEQRQALLAHLGHVCRIASGLGATRLTFGATHARQRGNLPPADAEAIARELFLQLAEMASHQGLTFCLEPVAGPTAFLSTHAEVAAFLTSLAQPGLALQLDTAALTRARESVSALLARHGALIGHVHASDSGLKPLGDGTPPVDHAAIAAALAQHLPGHPVTVEMLATAAEPPLHAIARALKFALKTYRLPYSAADIPL